MRSLNFCSDFITFLTAASQHKDGDAPNIFSTSLGNRRCYHGEYHVGIYHGKHVATLENSIPKTQFLIDENNGHLMRLFEKIRTSLHMS